VSLHPVPGKPGSFIDDTDGNVITIVDMAEARPRRCEVCAVRVYAVDSRRPLCERHQPAGSQMPDDS
jgi:Ni2+-binding GTPase involved in maturation of urease and hydrogenase